MKRFLTILFTLSILLGAMVPFAAAQDDMLADFTAGLPSGYWAVRAADLSTELVDSPPFLLDVRQPEEYEAGHIEGAINVPLREIAQNLDKLPGLDANIVVYCKSGHRGALGTTALQMLGYTNTRNLYGGILAWEAEEYPTVTEATEAEMGASPDIDAGLLESVDAMLGGIPEGWGVITPENLNISLADEDPFVVDVRTAREVAAGYIEGTDAFIEIHSLGAELGMLPEDKSAKVVIYCGSGWRSAIAEAVVWMAGYTDVYSLAGGVRGWTTAEYPLVQDMGKVADYALNDLVTESWDNISAEALNEMEEMPFLLDVREPAELEENGYIPGAVNIPTRSVAENLDLLPADLDAPIVVYCAKGTRGTFVTTALELLGFTNVQNLNGGFGAWAEAGYEVITDPIAEPEAGEAAAVSEMVLEKVNAALTTWPEGWGMVSADALSEALAGDDAPMLIDVRQPEEWVADGIIEGAVLVPLRDLGAYLPDLEAMVEMDAPIVVYCKAGHRGAIGMTVLRAAGFTNVQNLSGGFSGWAGAGMPVAEAPAD